MITRALSALAQIFERFYAGNGSTAQQQVKAVLQSEQAARVLQMRALRNRSMHYGVPNTLTGLAVGAPAYGLVEATTSGAARYTEVEADVVELLTKLSDALRAWRRA